MNKNEIRNEARRRMEEIEQLFIDMHVPSEVMSLYMLLKLICTADFDAYFSEFGLQELHPGDINDAKLNLGWGSLGPFERETCELLKEVIKRKELSYSGTKHRTVTGLRASH